MFDNQSGMCLPGAHHLSVQEPVEIVGMMHTQRGYEDRLCRNPSKSSG